MNRVLIVEDDPLDMESIYMVLSGKFILDTAIDLYTAISKLKSNPPDAVLLDPGLPDSQGFQHSIDEMKKHRANTNTAIVVVSHDDDPVRMKAGIAGNADGWVTKGVTMPQDLLFHLQRSIAMRRKCRNVEEGTPKNL